MGNAIGSVLTVVGYAVGSYFGFPQLGALVGSLVGTALMPDIEGPGAGDLSAPGLQLGSPMPRVYGRVRRPFTPIWASEFHATEHEADSGKGGPEGPSSYTYDIDMLGVICDGTNVLAVTRVWVNKKLVYTALAESDDESLSASSTTDYWTSFELFTGGPSQVPWSVYEDAIGAADAPANRGMCTVGFRGLQCGSSKQPPLVEVEVITAGTAESQVFLLMNGENGAGTTFLDESTRNYTVTAPNTEITALAARFGSGGFTNQATINQSSGFQVAVSESWTPDDDYTGEIRAYIGQDLDTTVRFVGVGNTATGTEMSFSILDFNSPDQKLLRLIVFDQSTDGPTWSPPDYPVSTGEWLDIALDYNGATKTARGIINGSVVLQYTYSGTPPAWSAINTTYSMYCNAINMSAGAWRADGVRHTMRRRYLSSLSMPNAAPTDDGAIWTPTAETLDDIIADEFALVPGIGLSDYDVTDLSTVNVTGYSGVGPPARTASDLCDVFYVDVVPGGRFQQRGSAPVAEIPYIDTGVGSGEPSVPFEGLLQGNDGEISGVKAVRYPNISQDHEVGFERGDRLVNEGPDIQVIETRVVMTPEQAKGRAITATLQARVAGFSTEFAISDKYASVEPGDSCRASDNDGNSALLRVLSLSYADGVKACRWMLEDSSSLVESGITNNDYTPSIIVSPAGVAEWEAMDLPELVDADDGPGYYLASKTSDDSRAFGYESADDTTYTQVAEFGLDAIFGSVSSIAGTLVSGPYVQYAATITVNVGDGTLSSSTRAGILSDRTRNAFAIGANERWVVGQFITATLVSAGVYTLTGILLDRWEDARHVGDLASSDVFCLLRAQGMERITRDISQLGIAHYVKVVAARRVVSSITGETFTAAGVSLKPLSPIHMRADRNHSTGDIELSCTRRTRKNTRFGGDLGDACPLGEESEQYRWRLFTNSTYATQLRDLGTTITPEVTYTAAQISADGGTITSPLFIDVRQVSASVNEGYPLQAQR